MELSTTRWQALEEPLRYRGLYIYDFGEWSAVGYTAEEIALLLESDRYRGGKIYKIHRAWPDGRMELRGVSPERFSLESGMFFPRQALDAAREDYEQLRRAAETSPLPCRGFLQLARTESLDGSAEFVTALIFPAEYEEEVGNWLSAAGFAGGDLAEGGISRVSDYYAQQKTILERQQLWSQAAIPSRSPEQVLTSVRRAVQR